jgi:hypothetical protein
VVADIVLKRDRGALSGDKLRSAGAARSAAARRLGAWRDHHGHGVRLVQEGCNPYRVVPGSQWSDVDRDAYAMWQRKLGFTGADADGWPGRPS